MPDNQFRAQRSPSPKTSPRALPPLSKFYYGPTQGRSSAEASPASYTAPTWTPISPQEQTATLPSRTPLGAPPYSPTQWAKNFPSHSDPAQGWDEHIPPPSAPPSGQFLDSYDLMHKASRSPVNPTWESNSPRVSLDASRWSVNYQPIESQKPAPPAKPPLPPRPTQTQNQSRRHPSEDPQPSQVYPQSIYSPKQPSSSRVSATTIDVPLFLQPFAYDPDTAPPLPPRRPSNSPPQQSPIRSVHSVPHPQRIPPPPPKIPLDHDGESQMVPPTVQRPRYDPQSTFDDTQSHMQSPRSAQRRPTYDPQDSHEDETPSKKSPKRHSLQPKIPTPRFSSFNAESALPPPPDESNFDSPKIPTPPLDQPVKNEEDRILAAQRLHQSSISPINNNDADRWVPNHTPWDSQAGYVPSPEPQNTTLAPRDGSVSTTDVSSNRAGLSTPESQQTSNTSYRESVNQPDHGRQEQQNDETFYWHSGRSSSDAEEGDSQSGSTTATPGQSSASKSSSIATVASTVRQGSLSLPVRSSSKAPSPSNVPYSASALGFGGPSDWEYFGDYEAEEVDDEELYARSKATAELPAESLSINNGGMSQDERQSSFEIDPAPVPDRLPARHLAPGSASREEVLERPKHETGDYTSTRLRMSSVQSPTRLNNSWNQEDRPISYYQRPDLDDVIRAWSEAPYVGVDRSKDASSQAVDDDDDDEVEVDRFPEASLASTPQDRFLGIDLILKDAPEMPKLPDSIDQPSPSLPSPSFGQQKFDKAPSSDYAKNVDPPRATSDLRKRFSKQLEPLIEREVEAADTKVVAPEVDGHTAQRGSLSRHIERTAIESSVKAETKDVDPQGPSKEHDKEQPTNASGAADNIESPIVDEGEDNSSRRQSKGSTSLFTANTPSETLQPTPEPGVKSVTIKDELHTSQIKEQDGQDISSTAEAPRSQPQTLQSANQEQDHEKSKNAQTERPLNARKSSKEDAVVSSGEVPPAIPSPKSSLKAPEEIVQKVASDLSNVPSLQENLTESENIEVANGTPPKSSSENESTAAERKTRETQENVDDVQDTVIARNLPHTPTPIKVVSVDPGERSQQHGLSKSAMSTERAGGVSVPGSPRAPSSPKNIKVVDPYADLDIWGKASLNRFAAMLREEARVESNRDKLNIFNVFTNRESRLRVVLYGSDDELILPTRAAEADENEQEPVVQKLAHEDADQRTANEQEVRDPASIKPATLQDAVVESSSESPAPDEQQTTKDGHPAQTATEQGSTTERTPVLPLKQNKKSFVQQAIERANTAISRKALPALPPNRDSIVGPPTGSLTAINTKNSITPNEQSIAAETNPKAETQSPSDETQYSPGGRPVIPKIPPGTPQSPKVVDAKVENRRSKVVDGNSLEPEGTEIPEARPRPRPKTKEGESEVNNYLTNRRSVYRPFASQTLETMENGSNFGRQSDIKIDSTPMPLLKVLSSKFSVTPEAAQKAESLPEVVPESVVQPSTSLEQSNMRKFVDADFDPLLMVLPEGEPEVSEPSRLQDLKDIMEAIPEDFSFIHASVVAWDANIRVRREANDKLRHERQAESEKRIDSLFDDHEIGYGDISELEAEFIRSEAARKADEDRSEYETFVSDVFDLVWARLHYELNQLVPHYDRYSIVMDETLAGKEMFETADDGLALASTMTQFLALHQKIEIRHQKAFEAVLERDRRLKKTEISPWYTLNNIPKVKQLEKQFEDAERRAIIEYCEQRDGRANQLMDVLDQNTLRGVGANQDYMEAIMKAVRRIASGRAFTSELGTEGAAAGLEEVKKAQTLTALLATSSEQIVQTFHVADMLLNSADYEVSVAKAKVARVDMATLVKLKEERAKEDQKLMRDLEHRLALIREDSRRTNDEIIKLMLFLGVQQSGRAHEGVPRALGVHMRGGSLEASAVLDMQAGPVNDPEHQERMRKALEEAKKRNASKASS